MKKLMIGLVLAGVCCGIGATAWAKTGSGVLNRKTVQVTPVENNLNDVVEVTKDDNNSTKGGVAIKSEIESYINNKYGTNWATDLYKANGEEWDDILEDELERKFSYKYEDVIESIIEAKEREAGLDIDDHDDIYDDVDDDRYDKDDNDEIDDCYDDDHIDHKDYDDIYDNDCDCDDLYED